LGFVDVDCDFVDFTYVRCDSHELNSYISKQVHEFKDALRESSGSKSGQISLEFYQKRKGKWLFGAECVPWEIWTVKLNVITLSNEHERQICREKAGESLAEKVLCIAEAMNRRDYVPKPNQSELSNVFDVSFKDIQPYLHRISYQSSGQPATSVGNTMKKMLLDTFSY
jgi:autophagy-related protein 101